MNYTELAKEMIKADLNEHKDFYLTECKDVDSFTEVYYQSTFKQGYAEETKEDFGYVLWVARVEEDNQNELLNYVGELFEELLENKIIQDKIAYGLLEMKYTAIFINNGRVFGYFKGLDKLILGVREFGYTILIEHSDEQDKYFEIARELEGRISIINESLSCLGIYTGYYDGEFEHPYYEITEKTKSMNDYVQYVKLFKTVTDYSS